MSGVKGKSGRKRHPQSVMMRLYDKIDANWDALQNTLIQKAIEGDREALMYCFDRRLGKPKASTEVNIEGGEVIGAGVVLKLFAMMAERERLLLDNKEGK